MKHGMKIIAIILLLGCNHALLSAIDPNSTFCNPININYQFNGGSRDAGDALIIIFNGDYYLFVSNSSGYWWSTDLMNWNYVRVTSAQLAIINNWAPAVYVYNNRVYFSANDVTGFWSTDNPKDPARWTKASNNAGSWDGWVLADDNGKYYMTGGCGGGAYQMDPATGAKISGTDGGCQVADVGQHGFESHVSSGNGVGGYCEGACLIQRLSRYYFFYSVPGTEFDEYCDGLGSSTLPISGFRFAQNSPVSFKPTGFLPGSGHGSAFMDKNGNWWRTVTTRAAGTNNGLCRRIGLYPLIFDDTINSAHTDCVFGDYPQYMPGKKPAGAASNLVGWNLLSYGRPATASSSASGHDPSQAFDETIRTFWSANTKNAGEWLRVDLQRPCTVYAVQTNFADYNLGLVNLYIQYTIEQSADGQTWSMLVDKSQAQTDLPHDYIQLPAPVTTRYLRITIRHISREGNAAISDFRVFGTDNGQAPASVTDFTVSRNTANRRIVTLTWRPAARAEGYQVRYGIAPKLMHNAYQINVGKRITYPSNWITYSVQDTTITFSSLNLSPTYYFRIDAFSGSGVTPGGTIKSDQNQQVGVAPRQPMGERRTLRTANPAVFDLSGRRISVSSDIRGAVIMRMAHAACAKALAYLAIR